LTHIPAIGKRQSLMLLHSKMWFCVHQQFKNRLLSHIDFFRIMMFMLPWCRCFRKCNRSLVFLSLVIIMLPFVSTK